MKKNPIILLLTITFLYSCGSEYEIKNNKVYYTGWNEGVGSYERLLVKADASSFEKIENEDDLVLGKDKNFVFHQDSLITDADPTTFKRIGQYYYTDMNTVYFFGFVHSGRSKWNLDSVDVKTLKLYDIYPWGRDKNNLIYGDLIVKIDNIQKFKPIDEYWGKTDNQVINEGVVFDSVHFGTFKIIDDYRAKDRNYRYEYGERIK